VSTRDDRSPINTILSGTIHNLFNIPVGNFQARTRGKRRHNIRGLRPMNTNEKKNPRRTSNCAITQSFFLFLSLFAHFGEKKSATIIKTEMEKKKKCVSRLSNGRITAPRKWRITVHLITLRGYRSFSCFSTSSLDLQSHTGFHPGTPTVTLYMWVYEWFRFPMHPETTYICGALALEKISWYIYGKIISPYHPFPCFFPPFLLCLLSRLVCPR